jgi:hypothetical protein
MMDEVTRKSELTEKDALEIGQTIKAGLAAKYSKESGKKR